MAEERVLPGEDSALCRGEAPWSGHSLQQEEERARADGGRGTVSAHSVTSRGSEGGNQVFTVLFPEQRNIRVTGAAFAG